MQLMVEVIDHSLLTHFKSFHAAHPSRPVPWPVRPEERGNHLAGISTSSSTCFVVATGAEYLRVNLVCW